MLERPEIPKELRKKIDDELESGEHIRWVDQPVPRLFTVSSISMVLIGIPWTSFALFWMWGASSGGILFAFFGVPFVFVGLAMLSSPIWEWRTARKTAYLITNKRAILFKGGFSTTIKSYLPEQLSNLYRKENADGTGDVIIEVEQWRDSDGDQSSKELGFLGVRNPREIESMLKQLAEKAS